LITSALIFSIIHFNIGGFLPIFFIGLYLGLLVYATKSIILAIFLHFLNNFFVIISMNYVDINYEQNIPIGFGLLLFILGGSLALFTYSKIKICKIN
jgi:membrane protease YdiL (CAAX protease family)